MTGGTTVVSRPAMGTVVTIEVVLTGGGGSERREADAAVERAFGWFAEIEARCSRFDPASELMRLVAEPGRDVVASPMLFEAVQFALAVAEETGGAFDPTIGRTMEARGFDREYRTGRVIETAIDAGMPVSYRDLRLDPERKTIMLLRPLVLDLGAVAKGLAVDVAARELRPFRNFAVDGGGDLYLSGLNPQGAPWSVGIRHPRQDGAILEVVRASDTAVCTSGDYERRAPDGDNGGHHIIDPRSGSSAGQLASVTVVAPTAMLADAAATATFVLGAGDGLALCDRLGVQALVVTPALEVLRTAGFGRG